MAMDINSQTDWRDLERRMLETLRQSGFNIGDIRQHPKEFRQDDSYTFEGLFAGVLSRQADFNTIKPNLSVIGSCFFNYDTDEVAALSDADVDQIYWEKVKPLKIKARFLQDELEYMRDNAKMFQKIKYEQTCDVWQFIKSKLNSNAYDDSRKCYIWPDDDDLIECFIRSGSRYKLSGVGLAICCEFFNNIGIDEFKPDALITRFFYDRICISRTRRPKRIREIGLKMATNVAKPRAYVDSLIWHFCRTVCKAEPSCTTGTSCKLKTDHSPFCEWGPGRSKLS